MKPKQWENVRDQVADAIETRHGEALQSRRPHRIRILIEIDLVTGESSATAEPRPDPEPAEPQPAPGLPS